LEAKIILTQLYIWSIKQNNTVSMVGNNVKIISCSRNGNKNEI